METARTEPLHGPLKVLWAAFLVALPVTSTPWLPEALGGATTVRPLAFFPLFPLIVYLLARRLFREGLPRALLPLVLFAVVAVIGGALAAVRPVPEFRFVTPLDRVIRNLLTLGMGASFYLAAALIPRTREDLKFTVRWLLIGFGVSLAWSSLQAAYVLNIRADPVTWEPFFDRLNTIHHWISTRNLQERRVTGMAYEPSWYAEQLTILVLPWLLVAAVRRESVFNRRLGAFLIEDALLVWTAAIMMLTFSRTGLVILFLQVGLTILVGSGRKGADRSGLFARLLAPENLVRRIGAFALVAVLFAAVVFSVGSRNRYFSRMWRFFTDEEAGGNYWAYIAFGQRFAYWEAAVSMYAVQPVFGIGVGNFALYFEDHLPHIPLYQYPEILELIVPAQGYNELVTPKNYFLRVLAETGLVGLAAFGGFWLVVTGSALDLQLHPRGDEQRYTWGRVGAVGLLACLLVAFSTDSFAMPNIWVFMGLITAAAHCDEAADRQGNPPSDRPRL
jgi:O-antigen ligase